MPLLSLDNCGVLFDMDFGVPNLDLLTELVGVLEE